MSLTSELRVIADTIERNGGWHIAAVKVRVAANQLDARPPYYCPNCKCGRCGNTIAAEKDTFHDSGQ